MIHSFEGTSPVPSLRIEMCRCYLCVIQRLHFLFSGLGWVTVDVRPTSWAITRLAFGKSVLDLEA